MATDLGALLDGINFSSFVRTNAFSTISENTRWTDNQQVLLGNGSDLRMMHSGGHNYFDIYEGNLYIRDRNTTRYTFDVNGTFTATGDVQASSDERLKADIEPIHDALGKALRINGCTFLKKGMDSRSVGVIAQDVQAVLPEAVGVDDDGYLSVAYGNLVGLLFEALRDQQHQIAELKEVVDGFAE